MADEVVNPYQPPAEEAAQAATANCWSVSGDYLLVRPGGLLPPVALEGSGSILTPVLYQSTVLAGGAKAMIASVVPIALVFVWMNVAGKWVGEGVRWTGVVVFAVIAILISSRFSKVIHAMVWGFAPVEALRARSRRNALAKGLLWLGLFILAVSFVTLVVTLPRYIGSVRSGFDLAGILAWLGPSLAISLALMIGSVASGGFKSGVRCTLFKDGWLHLKGIPRESLALLAAKSHEPAPGARMRRVYTSYLHQQPLGRLLGKKKWNLWNALRFAFWKSQRSPRLESLGFHFSERVTLPLSAADPELVAKWRKETTGSPLENWTLVLATQLESPQGILRVGFVFYASPDFRHFASLTVTRIAVINAFQEHHQSVVRTWTEDDRVFCTCTPPAVLAVPERENWAIAEGPLPLVFEAHLKRLGSTAVRAARDVDEFVGWMEKAAEESDAAAESVGLQSPMREMELQDFPK